MVTNDSFERILNGKKVSLFKLKNELGTELFITNYGARIVSLWVWDRQEKPVDVVVGFDSLDGYLTSTEGYYGVTVGRYANRIAKGRFQLAGKEYTLAINNGPNHLHGGPGGFHLRVWEVGQIEENKLTLSYLSADGEEGYPGNLKTTVQFILTEQNEVVINYEAVTDRTTVLNLTNHAFFNLNGQGSGTILNHLLQINASRYTPVDETLIPTGAMEPVAQTPFDFSAPTPIGKRIDGKHPQLKYGNGYDHNYVLDNNQQLAIVARATGDQTGIVMEVWTDQPGVQLYTGNFMSGENRIKGNVSDDFRTAFCLETQHFPDSPNQSNFPSTVLNPNAVFRSTTIYKFS